MQMEPLQVKGKQVWYWLLSCPYKHEREWDGNALYGNLRFAADWAGSQVTINKHRQFEVGVTNADGYKVYGRDGDYLVKSGASFFVMPPDSFNAAFK
jgi:hypothetical protein